MFILRATMSDKAPIVNFVVPTFFDMNGNNMFYGGAERYLLELAWLVRRMGYDTNVYQCANSDWVRYYRDLRVTGIKAQNTDQLNRYFHTNFKGGFLTIYFAFFLASPYFHQPSIGISHGVYWDEEIFQHFPYGRMARRQILSAISHLSTFVSVDTNTINWLRSVYLELAARGVYIPNFVDLNQFHPASNVAEKKRGRTVVLYPRRLNQVRGFWLAHRLVPDILEKYDNVEFHFVGRADVREEQAVRRLVDRFPGRVKWYFLPPEKMHEAYQQADIVLIPTLQSEGTSLSCLEALASGNAVIATNVGGLPNLVLPDFNGLLVEPDVESFSGALVRLLENADLRLQLAQRGVEVAGSFDIETWRLRWQTVLQKYLPARETAVEERGVAVFYPPAGATRHSSVFGRFSMLAGQLSEQGLDVYWVQSSMEIPEGNERLHIVTETDDLYLARPWALFDGKAPPKVIAQFDDPIVICDVSEGFSRNITKDGFARIDFLISDHESDSFDSQKVHYVPNAQSLNRIIQEYNR
ncbi:MAG: D-inositol-3-phosphate glycosyltransferase [Anaerolineales bacterium]|nr:D-inositol-3-phosphate glycosyltransferase [Anaerolineales bacterium]